MALLHDEAIQGLLQGTSWQTDGRTIVREFEFGNFNEAMAFANRVAAEADRADHHPDLLIHSYRRVQVRLCTHTEGGVTTRDVDLARIIDRLV